jgi:predicted esterase
VDEPLVYLGFSQGVAMAYRAAAFSGHRAQGLVVLAGDVPPDVAEADLAGFPRVLVARGDADHGYPAAQMERDLATLAAKGVAAEGFVFRGGHELTPELRARISEFLASLAGS